MDRKISKVSLQLPESVERRAGYTIKCRIADSSGVPVWAYMPVEVQLVSDKGVKLPGSGFYAAVNGELTVNEIMASNAPEGTVKVTVRCLASNKTASGTFKVTKSAEQ